MPAKSETSRLIDSIIATRPAPLLKSLGYRKTSRSFHAQAGDIFKIVQFQASMWNTPNSAQFTVNLNVAIPFFHEKWTGLPFPENPGSAAPVVSQRIGLLMPENLDYWWEITPTSSVELVASQVRTALANYGLPFLDQQSSLDQIIEETETYLSTHPKGSRSDLHLAILLCYQGNQTKASRVIRELKEKNRVEAFAETIDLIAQRLGL